MHSNTSPESTRDFGAGERRGLVWLALVGFYAYFLTFFGAIDVHHTALFLLLVYLVVWAARNWSDWKRSSLAWLLLAAFFYLVARYGYAYLAAEDDFSWNVEYGWPFLKLAGLFSFALVPFFSAGNGTKYLHRAFALIVIGLAIEIVRTLFIGDDARGLEHLDSGRPGFGMGPISFSMVSGFVIVGLVAFSDRFRRSAAALAPPLGLLAVAVVAVLLVLLFGGLILTQSVSNWAATAAALTALLLLKLFGYGADGTPLHRMRYALIPALLVLIGIFLVSSQWDLVNDRLKSKNLDPATLLATDLADIPEKALGARYHLYMVGASSIPDNPLFGVLPGGVEERLSAARSRHSHVHNLPLQVMAGFGLAGFLLLAAFVAIAIREVHRARADGLLPRDGAVFLLAAFVFFAVSTLFDLSLKFRGTVALLGFVAAVPIALQIARLRLQRLTA